MMIAESHYPLYLLLLLLIYVSCAAIYVSRAATAASYVSRAAGDASYVSCATLLYMYFVLVLLCCVCISLS